LVYFPFETKTHFKYTDKEKQIHPLDQIYIKMIEDFISRNNLFYSDSMDLTNNILKTIQKLEGKKTEQTVNTVKNTCKNFLIKNLIYFNF